MNLSDLSSDQPLPDEDAFLDPRHAHFTIETITPNFDQVIIRDLNVGMSVTNDAEYVVKKLYDEGNIKDHTRLYYYDTMGNLDELCHLQGKFTGFTTAPDI